MATIIYDSARMKQWSNEVIGLIDGTNGGDSIKNCADKFYAQIEVLVQPNVWTGAAAVKNYNDFKATYNTLIDFSNEFGKDFGDAMEKIAKNINSLELANLGSDTSVSSTFGDVTLANLDEMTNQNIAKEIVTYDYDKISAISTELDAIKISLENVKKSLMDKIAKIDNDSDMLWEGNAAGEFKSIILNCVNTNMPDIINGLDRCISNIKTAGENAQAADR